MKITLSDENVGSDRGQESTQRAITNRDELYLESEEDTEKFFKASHEIYIKEGYVVEMNYCPMLMARSKEVEVEHIFIDESMCLIKGTNLKREKLIVPNKISLNVLNVDMK